jgi:hypothetical protein
MTDLPQVRILPGTDSRYSSLILCCSHRFCSFFRYKRGSNFGRHSRISRDRRARLILFYAGFPSGHRPRPRPGAAVGPTHVGVPHSRATSRRHSTKRTFCHRSASCTRTPANPLRVDHVGQVAPVPFQSALSYSAPRAAHSSAFGHRWAINVCATAGSSLPAAPNTNRRTNPRQYSPTTDSPAAFKSPYSAASTARKRCDRDGTNSALRRITPAGVDQAARGSSVAIARPSATRSRWHRRWTPDPNCHRQCVAWGKP